MDNKIVSNRKYGWKRSKPDFRDKKYPKVKFFKALVLPSKVDLRTNAPAVYDQKTLGSCSANSIGGGHHFEQIKQNPLDVFIPSRLFIYYGEREIENTVFQDSGAEIRDGIKFIVKKGVCPESMWEYDISKFTQKPPQECYDVAARHTVESYMSLDNRDINQLKQCLADGFTFSFGFTVYESFESPEVAKTGIVPMPKITERTLGGHAQLACGYDDSINSFIVRNSWGPNWGINGYCYMPYEMVTNPNLAADFWTIRLVNNMPDQIVKKKKKKSWWQRIFDW
jgi:C1A family cysteine protease